MSAYESIMQGLNEALDHAQGKDVGARVHRIEVPSVDVAAIRASTGLSQGAFARSIGVAKGTLLNWEHGRRHPSGPAQVLLAMIAKKPSLVSELLRCRPFWPTAKQGRDAPPRTRTLDSHLTPGGHQLFRPFSRVPSPPPWT